MLREQISITSVGCAACLYLKLSTSQIPVFERAKVCDIVTSWTACSVEFTTRIINIYLFTFRASNFRKVIYLILQRFNVQNKSAANALLTNHWRFGRFSVNKIILNQAVDHIITVMYHARVLVEVWALHKYTHLGLSQYIINTCGCTVQLRPPN